jgi:hypothetical protein
MRKNSTVMQAVSGDLWGGAEAQVLPKTTALRTMDWNVELMVFNRREAFRNYVGANVPCRYVSEEGNLVGFLTRALRGAKALAPAVLVAHGYKESCVAFAIRLCLGISWIATVHGAAGGSAGLSGLKGRAFAALYRNLANVSAARIIVVSSAVATA